MEVQNQIIGFKGLTLSIPWLTYYYVETIYSYIHNSLPPGILKFKPFKWLKNTLSV